MATQRRALTVLAEKYGNPEVPLLAGTGKSGLTPLAPGPFNTWPEFKLYDECMVSAFTSSALQVS